MNRRLEVTGRAAARYLRLTPDSVRRAGEARLLVQHGRSYDAEQVLQLGARPFVDAEHLRGFKPASLLLLQQSPVVWLDPAEEDVQWRPAYGWSRDLSPEEARLSASAWWPVDRQRREAVRGLVSTLSSFVVTLAVIDEHEPVREERNGKVRFNVGPATDETAMGRALLRIFSNRRLEVRRGSSFLLP